MDPLLELAMLIKASQRELERRGNQVMQPLGLTGAQADALSVIASAEPLALKDLGELLIAEGGHPSRLIDRLVDAGLVARTQEGSDRRRVQLALTAKGRKIEKQAAAARHDLLELARSLIGDREVEPVVELLRELIEHSAYAELIAKRRELER